VGSGAQDDLVVALALAGVHGHRSTFRNADTNRPCVINHYEDVKLTNKQGLYKSLLIPGRHQHSSIQCVLD
jgi:hypothetical protein